ncbi:MAG TPA: hypothetical protein ENN41_08765 [Sediminispirochaeta sp.]|nr:hypothetical protein [Sediminispirochaeta sp.]
MTRVCYLIALIPNQDVQLKLQSLRRCLYRRLGLVSAQVLEPLVPLVSIDHAVAKDQVVSLLDPPREEAVPAPPVELGGLRLWEDSFFLDLSPEPLLSSLRSALISLPPSPHLPFAPYPGLFLSHRESSSPEVVEEALRDYENLPRGWKRGRIGLYSLTYEEGAERWWEDVEWTLEWQFPFRRWRAESGTELSI